MRLLTESRWQDRSRCKKRKQAVPTQPNQLFCQYSEIPASRDQRIMGHRLLEKSSLGYINPIFEHYHSMGLFHLNEMSNVHRHYGGVRITAHSPLPAQGAPLSKVQPLTCSIRVLSEVRKFEPEDSEHHPPLQLRQRIAGKQLQCGGMFIRPKCHKKLRHIGVDGDRPAVVYTCNDWCENSFTSPITKSTCCYCQSTYPVNALVPRDIEDYEITEEGIRTDQRQHHVQQHGEHL